MDAHTTTQRGDRWLLFLIVTIALNLGSALLFPILVTDAFTPKLFIVSVIPVIWGFSTIFFYRSTREKYVAGLATLGAIYWLLPSIGMPIQLLGT
jgi:hypothetical protein